MKTLEHEYNLFGDFGFNTSINDVKNYAVALSKKTHYDLANILRNHMQDVLAHLIGCKTFFDAIMASTTTYMYALSNHEIGKKKLTEFFSLLVELDSLGIHVDDINLYKNDVDKILEKELLKTPKVNRIYINYLSFNNLNDFFERVIQIFEIKPLFVPGS